MRVRPIYLADYTERACFADAAKFCARKMPHMHDFFPSLQTFHGDLSIHPKIYLVNSPLSYYPIITK